MNRIGTWAAAVVLLAGPACRSGRPLIDSSHTDMTTPGTIGGNLEDAGGGPVAGRAVHAVHIDTSARYSATTNVTGGFSIKVPPGKYRLQVDLREGERVLKDPGVIDINKSDLDANMKLVIGG